MKYLTIAIIGIAAIIGITVWLRKTPHAEAPVLTADQQQAASAATGATATATGSATTVSKKIITTKITTKNGMTIETLKEGTGEAITNGKTAVMQYTGMFTDGKVFDATSLRGDEPFSFVLGAGQVIKGWDQGVLGMKVGESRKLTIPGELAYGERGAGSVIPPNATLVFEVTLTAIK